MQESSETVNLALSGPTNATLGSLASATLTILDDETLPPVGDELYTYDQIDNILSKTGIGAYTYSATQATNAPITIKYPRSASCPTDRQPSCCCS